MNEIDIRKTRDFSYMAGATDPMTKAQKHIIVGDRGKKRKNRKELYGSETLRKYISEKYNIPFESVDLQKLTKQQAQDIIVTFKPQPRNTKKSKQEVKKCPICGKVLNKDNMVAINFVSEDENESLAKIELCSNCYEKADILHNEEKFSKGLSCYLSELEKNWKKGTKENTHEGDIIRIISSESNLSEDVVNKIGVIKTIDNSGCFHGTWSDIVINPEKDSFLVLKK